MLRTGFRLSAASAAALLLACGGAPREPLAPGAPPAAGAPDGGSAGASSSGGAAARLGLLTVVNGENDSPVAGAQVTVAGRPFTTDGAGQFTAPDPVLPDAQVEIMASGFLRRETLARSDTRFVLWPDRSGFDQTFVREAVYTSGFTQDSKLTRLNSGAFITFSPEVDGDVQSAVRDAAATLTAASGGRIPFTVGAGSPTITIRINSGAGFFAQNPGAAAFAEVPFLGNVIGGPNGAVNFRDASVGRIRALAAHELGHHFGLGHPTTVSGLMNAAVDANRSDFSGSEKLAMTLMLQRRPGNAFPDNDRAVIGAARDRGVLVYGCYLDR